jgi:hypothetical protein
MKAILLLLASCSALNAELLKLDELKTAKGRAYTEVVVTEKRPDGISIRHAGGTARIPFEDIPADIRKQLGGFDEGEAKEAREADKEALEEAEKAMSEAVAKKAAEDDDDEAEEEVEEDAEDDGDKEEKPKGEESPVKRVEPKNAEKLSVKITGSGDNKRHQITGRAGSQPLLVRYGAGEYDFFRVPAWETKAKTVALGTKYSVTASEDGKVVDTEGATRKTGLGTDTKLR